jgi:hypothetical protein
MKMSEKNMGKLRWMLMVAVIGTAVTGRGQQAPAKEAVPTPVGAVQPQDERAFLLAFVARELDENGKVVNSRRYDTMASLSSHLGSKVRTGAKVPVTVIGKAGGNENTYIDVGVNLDVSRARMIDGNRMAMQVSAEISSVDPATKDAEKPVIRQNLWVGDVVVPIGEHKVIFSSDDLASKRTMQIEVTVTPVR